MQQQQTILLMAGGTGGHIFPALAVADLLQQQGHKVAWLGSAASMEAQRVPAAGIEFHALSVSGLRGKGVKTLLVAPFKLVRSLAQALQVVRKVKPDKVIGFGGFASGPGGLAAWLLRIPLYVHEQNAVPGMTNKFLAKLAKQVFTAFPQAFAGQRKTCLVGNPVREAILNLPAPEVRYAQRQEPLRVLIVGGSLGAQVLNSEVPQALHLLAKNYPAVALPEVVHQTGANKLAVTQAAYVGLENLLPSLQVSEFIDAMDTALGAADLVICRAGALTLSELTAAGVASVLVPYPFAVDDHQTHNARYLSDVGAAVLVAQPDFTAASLSHLLAQELSLRANLATRAIQAHKLAYPQAGQNLIAHMFKEIS